MDRQQTSQRRATTPDFFVEQAIADRVEASPAAFNRNERAQITVSRELRNRLRWGSFFPVPTIGVRNNLSIDEGPEGGLIFFLLRGQFNSQIGTYRGYWFSLKIRRRRWLISAQGSSLREPWDHHINDVLTLKGFAKRRTLSGFCVF